MKLTDVIKKLKILEGLGHGERQVIMSSDAEGNNFHKFLEADLAYYGYVILYPGHEEVEID